MDKNNLYAYVDESGQDAKGKIVIVSVLVFKKEESAILERLEEIEKKSKKNNY